MVPKIGAQHAEEVEGTLRQADERAKASSTGP
jgi:hypothetical protein